MHKGVKLSEKYLRCPALKDLPPPPDGRTGWPWTEQSRILPDKTPDGQQWPKVSIITPCYNQGKFIEEAIRSVLLQGYPDLEYIIIDGGSTDETVDIIKKYEPWLAHWESESDRGQSHAINKGLERSTGKFFNWHNSDDVLAPDSLATMVSAMVKYPQAAYVHGRRIFIDDKSKVRGGDKDSCDNKISFSPDLTASISALKTAAQPACLMDRDLVIQAGRVDESLHYIMDIDLLLRIAIIKKPIYINSILTYVRIHPDTKSLQWNSQRARERICVARKIFSGSDLPCSVRKLKRQTLATAHRFAWRSYTSAGMYGLAIWHLVLDISFSPFYGWKQRLTTYKLFKLDKKVVKFDEEI
ncbi:MAG: glycosyltransferase family 2 protein [Phycisphaerae bacterium]|jgi:glycosyltransferase involved in cell wall biosynthesis